ncbi:MAG: putative bifunctional diguanylate cyclase/phosphodiesterase [Neptuniibacter sp.]
MNLGKRASFLILPVILVSYALAALSFYQQQSQSLFRLEQNQLDHKLSKLHASFNLYSHFVDAYQLSLIEGEALANYFREPNNIYRGQILTANLESSITRYFGNNNEFASLSIIDKENNLTYYIENSTDPFSSANPEQFILSASMHKRKLLRLWQHIPKNSSSIIQQAVALDARTFAPPLITDMEHVIQIVVAVSPYKFDQQLKRLQQEYNSDIRFVSTASGTEITDETTLGGQIQLRKSYFLDVIPDTNYMTEKLSLLKQKLAFIFIVSSALTFGLLQLLIRHFVISPIAHLDTQLTAVMESRQEYIAYQYKNDEVSRLGRKFHQLHEKLNASLQETFTLSRTDSLTKLPNRAAFYEVASHLLTTAKKNNEQLTIIYLDLDNFKFVNDKYGHEVGDQLLKAVATRLKHTASFNTHQLSDSSPQVFRLSGDEFIIMLYEKTPEFVNNLGEKILNVFSNGYSFELGQFPVTASLGIASFPEDGHTLSQLISNADLAMYQAKKSGKNKQAVYSKELAKKDRSEKEIESRLKEIDFNKEFTLNYMPIINHEGKIKGCEALLRWNSSDLGPISPALFIPIAENSGAFKKIDLWVVQHVFLDLPVLKALLGDDIEVSINLSSAELNSDHFITELTSLETQFKVNTENIIFEITETFAPEQEQNALEWLHQLRESGYKIAIDDFGAGYTSLMQMMDYPVDIIKFDKQLVERITHPEKQALTKPLIDLCHQQGIEVVAEGVESLEQYNLLREANCNFQQGFLIAKPMSIDDLKRWLSENSQNRSIAVS